MTYDSSHYPALFGTASFGETRFGVIDPRWEETLRANGSYRTIERRVANWNVPRDSRTGIRYPTYTPMDIEGVLEEAGQESLYLGAGVATRLDARLVCIDGVNESDQIYDREYSMKLYSVVGIPVEISRDGGFCWRVCQLKLLPLRRTR